MFFFVSFLILKLSKLFKESGKTKKNCYSLVRKHAAAIFNHQQRIIIFAKLLISSCLCCCLVCTLNNHIWSFWRCCTYYGMARECMTSFIFISCSVDVHTFHLKFGRGMPNDLAFCDLFMHESVFDRSCQRLRGLGGLFGLVSNVSNSLYFQILGRGFCGQVTIFQASATYRDIALCVIP